MRLPLSSATARCLARRGTAAAMRAPLVTGALSVVAVALPVLAGRATRSLTAVSPSAFSATSVGLLVVASFALTAAAGGAATIATLARPADLAMSVLAGPTGLLDRLGALLLLPLLTVVVGVVPTAVAVLAPISAASPGGLASLPALAAALVAAAVYGGCVLPAVRKALSRRSRPRDRAAATTLVVGLTAGVIIAARSAAGAIAGSGGETVAIVTALAMITLCGGALEWLLEAGADGAPRRARSRRLPARASGATVVAGLVLLVRRREVRAAIVGGLVVGGAGLVLGRLAEAPAPAGALAAIGGAVLVLAPVGLAVSGVLADGRALWSVVPPARAGMCAALAAASGLLTFITGAAVAGAALIVGQAARDDLPPLGALIVGGWLCALAAGAIVPWARAGAGGQSASLGAFAVLGGVAAICAGRVTPTVAAAGGTIAGVAWAAVGLAAFAVAVTGLAALVGRPT